MMIGILMSEIICNIIIIKELNLKVKHETSCGLALEISPKFMS